jgi:ankyrin repeat protein
MLREGAGCGDMPRVEHSIRQGASVNNFKESSETTALYSAANGGQLRICRLLLKLGASPDIANQLGKTPLMAAAEEGNYDICKLLLSRKVNPSKKDGEDCTALHYAAYTGHTKVCILLVENGADVNAKNKKGDDAFWNASRFGKFQTADFLAFMEFLESTGKKTARSFLSSFNECLSG